MNDNGRIPRFAREYLDKGFRPIPVNPATKAPIPAGWQDLVPDLAFIERAFGNGAGYNLGVVCGQQPNDLMLLAIDIDPGHGGAATWAALVTAWGGVPAGPVHQTPSGGQHLFFNVPPAACRTGRNTLGIGVDTRGIGGQVVVPPSRFVDPATGEVTPYVDDPQTSLLTVPVPNATPAMVQALLSSLSAETPVRGARPPASASPSEPLTPLDLLRRSWNWVDELIADGWEVSHQRGDQVFMTRPGKSTRQGHSAVVHLDTGHLVVWSSNVPLELSLPLRPSQVNRDGSLSWSPGDYLAATRFDRDLSAAASWVRRQLTPPTAMVPLAEAPEVSPIPPPGFRLPVVEDAYWQGAGRNRHIFQAARASLVSPDALDLVMYALQSTLIPPRYLLPMIVGGKQPLNFLACLVAPTGVFKTSTLDAARDLMAHIPPWVVQIGMGSGEGIGATFLREEMEVNAKTGRKQKTGRLERNDVKAAFFEADEGSGLTEQAGRKGATIIANLCKAWSGSTLGEANADPTKRRHVLDRDYRIAALVNIQPSNFAGLFSIANTGTGLTGRFMFSGTADYDIPEEAPEHPGALELPTWPDMPCTLEIAPSIVAEAKARIRERHRTATLDTHVDAIGQNAAVVARMAGIAVLCDDRRTITEDDWNLAQMRAQTSAQCLKTLDTWSVQVKSDLSHKAAEARAETEITIEDVKERQAIARMAEAIRRVVAEEPLGRRKVMRAVSSSTTRYRFEGALGRAVGNGWVRVVEDHIERV